MPAGLCVGVAAGDQLVRMLYIRVHEGTNEWLRRESVSQTKLNVLPARSGSSSGDSDECADIGYYRERFSGRT